MPQEYSIDLKSIIDEMELEVLFSPLDPASLKISNNDVNRPGLQFAGFYEYYDDTRIQIAGKAEFSFLDRYDQEKRAEMLDRLFSTKPPAFIITSGIDPYTEVFELAEKYDVPILRGKDSTSAFMAKLIALLNIKLAPRITRHGVLIEVYGEGMLILGESGVGKSEAAIELVKRGHRLVADDAVEIRKTSNITLVGSSPDNIRHFLELRGIGIINVRQLYGMGSIKISEKIDLVVEMEIWNPEKTYDRMGVDDHFMSILGVKVPYLTIPVKPGRNLAVIMEVAAMNNRHKKMGYNAAQELLDNLGMNVEGSSTVTDWNY
ncbi:MAG: HPr(Ser) kinase/phosphatase [Eubacterium sp.]|nr:HPr(Ser) kinase/phosphatase [Eubacterium sp.]